MTDSEHMPRAHARAPASQWTRTPNKRQRPSWTVVKKDVRAANDPALSQAATQTAATADRAQAFSEKFYNENISPLLTQMVEESKTANAREDDLYKFNKDIATKSNERYEKYGIPAEERYYKMVDDYSSDAEQENQARGALGDMRTAEATQQQSMMRTSGARYPFPKLIHWKFRRLRCVFEAAV